MDKNKETVLEKRVERTLDALRRNQMEAFYVAKREGVVPLVEGLLKEGDRVAVGGSMTLTETGVIEHLRCGRYDFLDRTAPGLTAEEVRQIQLQSFGVDTYLASVNAITEAGELYFVDGNGNRVAAVLFGPTSVILVAGVNKIVGNLDGAVRRVKEWAAPANCLRLSCDTYCREKGQCVSLANGKGASAPFMTAGCGQGRICCDYVVLARQRLPGRIKVILVGEELGY